MKMNRRQVFASIARSTNFSVKRISILLTFPLLISAASLLGCSHHATASELENVARRELHIGDSKARVEYYLKAQGLEYSDFEERIKTSDFELNVPHEKKDLVTNFITSRTRRAIVRRFPIFE